MIDVDVFGTRIIDRYEEGTDLFGFQYIKFAIATNTNRGVLKWTLFITPTELLCKESLFVMKVK
ncbi:hypothetical protein OCI51_27720 (plasmid) [Lysinibacillus capsici]|uniref:hypothetical protein n=1 Tax=Lysinibacillus capsici TaxID=2115968 RepID=UPI0021D848AB|nr:hypothetical protein [Lysinibacillus capsici]UYB50358.1 hypothetical protein OCI51_27720 [Lysinibacillus capsici]